MMYKIANKDVLHFLTELETESIGGLITDPPYSSGGTFISQKRVDVSQKYGVGKELAGFTGDSRDQKSYQKWLYLWLSECFRLIKPAGIGMLFTDWRQLSPTIDALQMAGFTYRGVVPWHKPSVRPQSGRFNNQCEYIVWGSKGQMPRDYSRPTLQGFYSYQAPKTKLHMTEKPVELLRHLVNIVPKGEYILDPFMGSASAGVAALLEDRKFIGCEYDGHYFNVAEMRLKNLNG